MKLFASTPVKLPIVSVTLLLFSTLMTFVLQHPVSLIAGTLICAIYAFGYYRFAKIGIDHVLFYAAICMLFLPAFFKPYHGMSPIFYFFSTVSVFFAAKAVTQYSPDVFLGAIRLIYAFAVIAIALALYINWGQPEPLADVIPGSSTNGIPAYLIVIQIGLSLSNYLARGQMPLVSPLITGVVAFFGFGRGSLVVAALIIVISIFYNLLLINSASRSRKVFFPMFLVAAILGLSIGGDDLLQLLDSYTKLGAGLVDTSRLEIWEQYIDKINPWTLLFGADYAGTVIEGQYQGNPHISYIRTHSLFGLPIMLLALASPAFLFLSKKTITAKIICASLISMAALRAATEPILFPTLLDFFYFTYFFLFFRYAPDYGGPMVNGVHQKAKV